MSGERQSPCRFPPNLEKLLVPAVWDREGTGQSGLWGGRGDSLSFFMPASRHFRNLQAGQCRLWALLILQLPAKGQLRPVLLPTVRL